MLKMASQIMKIASQSLVCSIKMSYRGLHNPYNTEKAELTSIFVSGYIHCTKINFHTCIWKLIQSVLQGLCKLLYQSYSLILHTGIVEL